MMKTLSLLPGVLVLALAAPVAAQTETPAPTENCNVQPKTEQGGSPDASSGKRSDSLTETLDPCGGVLKPPPTGDKGVTAPPIDQGNMPVIKPGDVPAQPPKQN